MPANIELPAYERSISKKQAEPMLSKIVNAFLSQHNISLREIEINSGGKFCVVAESESEEIVSGFGKGVHARLGAFGECVEHLHLWESAKNHLSKTINVHKSAIYQNDIFLRIGSSLTPAKSEVCAIPYQLLEGRDIAYIPFGLVNCDFDMNGPNPELFEVFYHRYASSSGTAFGFSHDDALLHAMLEIIERDEISRLFLNIMRLHGDDEPYDMLTAYDFHPEILKLSVELRDSTKVDCITIVRKSVLGPFFSFSFCRQRIENKEKIIWGAGCSLFRDLAIYRSLAECQQSVGVTLPKVDDRLWELARRFSAFESVARLDILKLNLSPKKYNCESIDKIDIPDQISILHCAIRQSGREVLFYDHNQTDKSYHVVSAIITDTEKFFGIIFALPLLPIGHLKKYDQSPPNS